MASSLNKVMLIGNLGSEPEVRNTPNGAQVANFRVACTESWKDQSGQKQERTEWATIVAWRQQAEFAQRFLKKGTKVYVEGKLQTRQWEDKNGGGKRYATEVVCDHFMVLSGGNNEQGGHGSHGGHGSQEGRGGSQGGFDEGFVPTGNVGAPADDDLPF